MAKVIRLPDREDIVKRMWRLANAGAEDAVRLACFPPEEWQGVDKLELDALTEFKRGSNGVVELKFIDRLEVARQLLERLPGESRLDPAESFFQLTKEG